MQLTWAEEHFIRGMNEGKREGKREGTVLALKHMTGTLLIGRFGKDAHPLNEQLQAFDSPEALEEFFTKAVSIRTLEQLNLEWDRIALSYPNPAPSDSSSQSQTPLAPTAHPDERVER